MFMTSSIINNSYHNSIKLTGLKSLKCGSTANGVCKYSKGSRRKAVLHDFQSNLAPREAESKETYEEQTKSHVFSSDTSFLRLLRFHACRGIPQTVKQRTLTHFRYCR